MNFTILKNSNPEPIIKFSSDFYDFEIEENVKMGSIVGRVGLARFSNWCRRKSALNKPNKIQFESIYKIITNQNIDLKYLPQNIFKSHQKLAKFIPRKTLSPTIDRQIATVLEWNL